MLLRDALVDRTRENRTVPIKVYYPVNHSMTGLPVIIWSHGLGGSVDGAAFLSRFLATHGYVLVHVQHPGTDSSLWEGKPGHPWDVIRKAKISRQDSLDRFADVPFVLDRLPDWMTAHPEIGTHTDLSVLGMSGHSFGALTAQIMAGQMFPDRKDKLCRMKEDRFTAAIAYSPAPIDHLTDAAPEDLYASIDLPLFHMTGTEDASPVGGWGYERRLAIYDHSGTAEKHLLILNGGDHMVYNGSRGKLSAHPDRHLHEEIIRTAALVYWDATLKKDENARAWLTDGRFASYLGKNGTYRWNG